VRHAVVVNPDSHLRRIAAEEGWEVVHLDRLGRRLKLIAAVGAGTMLASLSRLARERRPPRGRRGAQGASARRGQAARVGSASGAALERACAATAETPSGAGRM